MKKVVQNVKIAEVQNVDKMILQEQDIKNILNKIPKVMKSNLGNFTINQYEYTQKEQLDLIQTYIKEKKGIDVGEINLTQGTCHSFINFMVSNKLDIMTAMQRSDSLNALDYAFWYVTKYYVNKFRENED